MKHARIVIAASLLLVGCSDWRDYEPLPLETLTYVNPVYEYSIEYPSNWLVSPVDYPGLEGDEVYIQGPMLLNILLHRNESIEEVKKDSESVSDNCTISAPIALDHEQAIAYECSSANPAVRSFNYLIAAGNNTWRLYYLRTPADTDRSAEETMKEMISSFSLD